MRKLRLIRLQIPAAIVVILSSSAGSLFKSCVLGQDTLLSQCLSPPGQVYKWVLANLILGIIPQWISMPSRREWQILVFQSLHATKTRINPDLILWATWLACSLKLYITRVNPSWS